MMWISASAFARIAGLDRTSASRICRAVAENRKRELYPGLEVRLDSGRRGGRSGKCYEIKVASLPPLLRDAFAATEADACRPLASDAKAAPDASGREISGIEKRSAIAARRFRAIRTAMEAPRGSDERHIRVLTAAAISGSSRATIYRWIDLYEERGLKGLVPVARQPSPPCVVSRSFDKSFLETFGADALSALNREVEKLIPALWTRRESRPGMNRMAIDLAARIEAFCHANEWDMGDVDYRPSIDRIRQFRRFKLVREFMTDANQFHAILPKVRRNWEAVEPMEIVFLDVKFADMHVMHEGVRVRPAIIGFYDAGTGRLFAHLVRVIPRSGDKAGTSVTGEQVLEAFGHMLCSQEWGQPRALYMDNGQENILLESALARLATGADIRIVHAGAYQPQAKLIEGAFGHLNKQVFAPFRAFNGGKPRQLRENRGDKRAPADPGDWKEFCRRFSFLLSDYHSCARNQAPSPQARYEKWQKTSKRFPQVWSPARIAATFGESVSRTVRQGWVLRRGERYVGDHLLAKHGERVRLIDAVADVDASRLAKWCSQEGDPGAPFCVDDDGFLQALMPDVAFPPLDEGATGKAESERRIGVVHNMVLGMIRQIDQTVVSEQERLAVVRKGNVLRRMARGTRADAIAPPSVTTSFTAAPDTIRDGWRATLDKFLEGSADTAGAKNRRTRIYRAIHHQLARAWAQRSHLAITGSPKLGKTYAARDFAKSARCNWLYVTAPKKGGVKPVLAKLREVLSEIRSPLLSDPADNQPLSMPVHESHASANDKAQIQRNVIADGGIGADINDRWLIIMDDAQHFHSQQIANLVRDLKLHFKQLDPILVMIGGHNLSAKQKGTGALEALSDQQFSRIELDEEMLDENDFEIIAGECKIDPQRLAWCRDFWSRGGCRADYGSVQKLAALLGKWPL